MDWKYNSGCLAMLQLVHSILNNHHIQLSLSSLMRQKQYYIEYVRDHYQMDIRDRLSLESVRQLMYDSGCYNRPAYNTIKQQLFHQQPYVPWNNLSSNQPSINIDNILKEIQSVERNLSSRKQTNSNNRQLLTNNQRDRIHLMETLGSRYNTPDNIIQYPRYHEIHNITDRYYPSLPLNTKLYPNSQIIHSNNLKREQIIKKASSMAKSKIQQIQERAINRVAQSRNMSQKRLQIDQYGLDKQWNTTINFR